MKRHSKTKKDFPLFYSYLVGTMYLFILLTAVLGIALILQYLFDQQATLFYPERSPIHEGTPLAVGAEPILLLQIFSTIITNCHDSRFYFCHYRATATHRITSKLGGTKYTQYHEHRRNLALSINK